MSDLAKGSVLCRAGGSAEIALAEIAMSLRQVPGNGVEALAHRLQHPLPIFGKIESAAEHEMEGRSRERELLVFDAAEVGTILGIAGRILAQHQNVLAVEPPEV